MPVRVVYVVVVVGAHGIGQDGSRQQQQEAATTRGNETHASSNAFNVYNIYNIWTYNTKNTKSQIIRRFQIIKLSHISFWMRIVRSAKENWTIDHRLWFLNYLFVLNCFCYLFDFVASICRMMYKFTTRHQQTRLNFECFTPFSFNPCINPNYTRSVLELLRPGKFIDVSPSLRGQYMLSKWRVCQTGVSYFSLKGSMFKRIAFFFMTIPIIRNTFNMHLFQFPLTNIIIKWRLRIKINSYNTDLLNKIPI